jgi:hypothetical protein
MPGGDPVSQLVIAVDGLLVVDTASVGDAELQEMVRELRRQRARLSAVEVNWSHAHELRRWRRDDS